MKGGMLWSGLHPLLIPRHRLVRSLGRTVLSEPARERMLRRTKPRSEPRKASAVDGSETTNPSVEPNTANEVIINKDFFKCSFRLTVT